jgi:hypothetical protein
VVRQTRSRRSLTPPSLLCPSSRLRMTGSVFSRGGRTQGRVVHALVSVATVLFVKGLCL